MAQEKRILYIDPVGKKAVVQTAMFEYLQTYTPPGYAQIPVVHLGSAPLALEYYTYLTLIGPDLLRAVKQAERDGYDAAVIGCFCDPFLDAAKELCETMVVVGVMEAAVHLAATLAPRFSILAAQRKSVEEFRANLARYGLSSRLASFRSLEICVEDLTGDAQAVHKKMRAEISAAIHEDGAEAVILGCTCQLGHFSQLQREFGVPVIDAALAGLLAAETLIAARDRFGWYTSKACSHSTPPKGALAALGLAGKYGFGEML